MKGGFLFVLLFLGAALLYACDGAISPVVEITLINGEVLKGHLHMDICEGDTELLSQDSVGFEKHKNGDILFQRTDKTEKKDQSYTLYTKTVRLPWAYFYIAESKTEIQYDQIKTITFQSEFESEEFMGGGAWYEITQAEYDKIQKGVYGFIVTPGPMSDYLFLKLNEKLSRQEFILYIYLSNNDNWGYTSLETSFPFIKSRDRDTSVKNCLDLLRENDINEYTGSRITGDIEDFEAYIPLIRQNKILKDESKKVMVKALQDAVRNLRLFKKLIDSHQNMAYTSIPVKDFPKELIPLAKNSKLAASFYIRLAEQVIDPPFSSIERIETIEKDYEVMEELGIISLSLINRWGN